MTCSFQVGLAPATELQLEVGAASNVDAVQQLINQLLSSGTWQVAGAPLVGVHHTLRAQ